MAKYRIEGQVFEADSPEQANQMYVQMRDFKALPWHEQALIGTGRGMTNVGRQVGNMVGMVSDDELAEAGRHDAPILDSGWGQAGNLVGEVAALAPAGGAAGGALRSVLPKATSAMGQVASRLAGYGAEGATEGAILAGPDNRLTGSLQGAAIGSGTGGAMEGAAKAGGKLLQGARGTPAAQTLIDAGVDLTPGQMNPLGAMSAIEESVAGRLAPGVANAREASQLGTYESMVNQSLPAGAAPVPKSTSADEMVDAASSRFNDAYAVAKGRPAYVGDLGMRMVDAADFAGLTEDVIGAEQNWIRKQITRFRNKPVVKTDDLIKLRSDVRRRAASKAKQGDNDRADALFDVADQVTESINEALPLVIRPKLQAIDSQYHKFKIVQDMAYKAGDKGIPTPHQMSTAIKQAALSKGGYAAGKGPMRDISKAAAESFAMNTPKTGMANALPLAAAAAGYTVSPASGIAGLVAPTAIAAGMAGTRTGRRLYRGETGPQHALRSGMEQIPAPVVNLSPPAMRALAVSAGTEDEQERIQDMANMQQLHNAMIR